MPQLKTTIRTFEELKDFILSNPGLSDDEVSKIITASLRVWVLTDYKDRILLIDKLEDLIERFPTIENRPLFLIDE